MARTKYPISKEFFPFNQFTPPMSRRFVMLAQLGMKTPRFLWKDPQLHVQSQMIPGYQGAEIEVFILTPEGLPTPAPCLVHIHGGGFVFEGSSSHYHLAMTYAKDARCKVVYVRYRLAPKNPFPVPQEDCYAALCWVYDHAEELGINRERIGICGDSAGGTLTVTSCMMARDRHAPVRPLFQLLVYPWLDDRNVSDSYHRFTDTPMWNSTLSKKVGPLINPSPSATPLAYRSPVEADSLAALPPAYVEVAEFDCLHDDGVLYAQLLEKAGVSAELHETRGTMHGFDTVFHAPTSQAMIKKRVAYMRKMFDT
ncbi:MAG: alpha/beta hydrolase [Clostridia bacterium]|nr:alpha/beta hydrolase [Clostridia bacterium]